MNEQQPKQNSSSRQSVAAAYENSGGNGISFEAPVQFKLLEGRTYTAKKSETAFTTKSGKTATDPTQPGAAYSVLGHYLDKRTAIQQAGENKPVIWVQQRSNEEDQEYYSLATPKLYKKNINDPNVDSDDPLRLQNQEIFMYEFPQDHLSMPKSPQIDDVEQGELTDCSLMSSMIGFVNSESHKKELQTNFKDEKKKKEVTLYEPIDAENRKQIKSLDEYESQPNNKKRKFEVPMIFPFLPEGEATDENTKTTNKLPPVFLYSQIQPEVFSNVKENKQQPTWPMVYESAIAQQLGGEYSGLDDHEPEFMMSIVSGMKPLVFDGEDMITYLHEVKMILDDDGVVIATTLKAFDENIDNPKKFTIDHAYAVVEIEKNELTLINPNKSKLEGVTTDDLKKFFMKLSVLPKRK